jgi:hypothetical protein
MRLTCVMQFMCGMSHAFTGAGKYHARNYLPPAAMQGSRDSVAPAGTKVEMAASLAACAPVRATEVRATVKRVMTSIGMSSIGMRYAEAAVLCC